MIISIEIIRKIGNVYFHKSSEIPIESLWKQKTDYIILWKLTGHLKQLCALRWFIAVRALPKLEKVIWQKCKIV